MGPPRSSVFAATVIGALIGALIGFLVTALLFNYPKDVVTRHRFCQACAEYEETYDEGTILGAEHDSRQRFGGPVHELLASAVGEHDHRWTPWATIHPTFGVPPEHPEVAERARAIREIEGSPRLISVLDQAMRNDRERTVALVQRLIDPGRDASMAVLTELDRDEPWPQRWTAVDARLR